jgi:uncharacterized small protein (TIGR04563 family)
LTNSPRPPQVSALSSESRGAAESGDGDEAPASQSDKRKQSLYFPEAMLEEIHQEAARLERSLSWIVQRAWKTARPEIRKLPSSRGGDGGDES